jgi:hypothetical protein
MADRRYESRVDALEGSPENRPAMARIRLRAARIVTVFVATAVLVAACSSSAPSASPSVVPTPSPTPNPHLPSPATAKQVFAGLGKAGLTITANTATLGPDGSDVVTRIFATYLGWPLDVIEYRSSTALTKAITWANGEEPGKGEPPAALAGMNILIVWGPARSGKTPGKLNDRQVAGLTDLAAAADVLLSPMKARTTVPVKLAAVDPGPSAAASASPEAD